MLLVLGLLCLPAIQSRAQEQSLQTWAVVATDEIAASGLLDLLTVRLSQSGLIRLVERQRLDDAKEELQLAALLQAQHVRHRMHLGQILGADALMVLSARQANDQRLLRIVVCDAKLGIRLSAEELPYLEDIEKLADQCAAVAHEVCQRFADGIKQIVAIPPFLNKDFEEQFNDLQSRCSDVLGDSLMMHAGVAVVEIEESRAILRELQDTLLPGLERPIATVVEAAYRSLKPDAAGRQLIKFEITINRGGHSKEITESVPLATVEHWLTTSLAQRLLAGGQNATRLLDVETQRAILARHADRFAELGHWDRSIPLRESALVLAPNDHMQRAILIGEYRYRSVPVMQANGTPAKLGKRLPPGPRKLALRQAIDDYVAGLKHLEYLVQNRLIHRVDAVAMLHEQCWYKWGVSSSDPVAAEVVWPACDAQRSFINNFAEQIDKLPPGRVLPQHLSSQYYGFNYTLTQHVLNDVLFTRYSPESLELLWDLVTRILPDDAKVSTALLFWMQRRFETEFFEEQTFLRRTIADTKDEQARRDAQTALAKLTREGPHIGKALNEWLAYLQRLTQSDRVTAKLYGYWGLMMHSGIGSLTPAPQVVPVADLFAEIDSLLANLERHGQIDPADKTAILAKLTMIKNRFRGIAAPRQQLPTAPSETAPPRPAPPPFGRMKLDAIDLIVEGEQRTDEPLLIKGVLACGPQLDAYWTANRFFVMHKPGMLQELKLTEHQSEHDLFMEPAWDGECIWLFVRGEGLIAIDPDGTRLATFKQIDDMPGLWKGFKLLGLSPRRALIVASFGEQNRAWMGILEIDRAGNQSANIFFESKLVAEGRSPEAAAMDPRTVFQPDCLQHLQDQNGKSYVLVNRKDLPHYLLIDMATLEVTPIRALSDLGDMSTKTDFGFAGKVLLREGKLTLAPSDQANTTLSGRILLHDSWVYRPGYIWVRQHIATGRLERLQRVPLPAPYLYVSPGVSSHYGLVAFDLYSTKTPLSRVTILNNQAAPPPTEAAQ